MSDLWHRASLARKSNGTIYQPDKILCKIAQKMTATTAAAAPGKSVDESAALLLWKMKKGSVSDVGIWV